MDLKKEAKKVPFIKNFKNKFQAEKKRINGAKTVKKMVKSNPSVKVVIGAGGKYDEGWIPTNIEYLNLLKEKDWKKYFKRGTIDALLAEHVWEHLTPEQGALAAKNCFEYLKSGGYLRVAVPDGLHPAPEYIEWVRIGGKGPGAHDHKVLYTHETFGDLFESVGFKVNLLEYHDASGKFHFNDWDTKGGTITRSIRFDRRNQNGKLGYTSVILDAVKP